MCVCACTECLVLLPYGVKYLICTGIYTLTGVNVYHTVPNFVVVSNLPTFLDSFLFMILKFQVIHTLSCCQENL